jgi:hybrid cluster-associated redox disulfide protein
MKLVMVTPWPNPEMTVAALLALLPQAAEVFLRHRMACVGCPFAPFDTLSEAASTYGLSWESFAGQLRALLPPREEGIG